jgi:hypothetical protein
LARDDWAERLFADDHRIIRWVIDYGWLDEKALAACDFAFAKSEFVALVLGVLEEGLYLLILHLVLNAAEHDAFIIRVAHLERLADTDECLDEWLLD